MIVSNDLAKKSFFIQEFRTVLETRSIFAPVATTLVADAKLIESPYVVIGDAKAHQLPCRVPLTTATLATSQLILDRFIGNAIEDCPTELSYANFGLTDMLRRALLASVTKKQNLVAAADFLAGATNVAGTVALGTPTEVATFLNKVAADSAFNSVTISSQIDNATATTGSHFNKPFIVAGSTAYAAITNNIATIVAQSSTQGLVAGKMTETPYGVLVINAGTAFTDPKQMIFGTGGALTMAFRGDKLDVGMGEMVARTTAGAASLDLVAADPVLAKTWYIYAQTQGRNGIFANVASLVSKQKMT